jgi:hypothetical protein
VGGDTGGGVSATLRRTSKSRGFLLARIRTRFVRGIIAAAFIGALMSASAARSQSAPLLPLQALEPCRDASPPRLPEKWRASYLMAPHIKSQLVLGEIIVDAALPAMRVKLYGVRRGSADLLVLGGKTYALETDGSTIKACRDLGDTRWQPLPQDWLTPRSQCVGSGPLGATVVDWWKTPIQPAPASYWTWHRASDQSPFRLVFPFASDRLAPLSRYAMSYQVGFEPLSETDLPGVAEACKRAKPAPMRHGRRALHRLIEAMPRASHRAEGEIRRLMPALEACPAAPLPEWPETLAITGLMTPIDSDEDPYPAEVLYDWTLRAQRSRIFFPPESAIAIQDSLLLDPQGYTVTHHRPGGLTCEPVLPGAIRPDWASRAPCSCEATINGTTPLTPHGTSRILACPLATPRVAWAWYALSDRSTVFMVTSMPGDEGKGLFAVLDYRDWLPGHPFPRSELDKPLQCKPAPRSQPAMPPASSRCSTCHLGPTPPRK